MRRLLAALLAALLLSGCAALAEPEEVWEGYQPFLPEEGSFSPCPCCARVGSGTSRDWSARCICGRG